MFGQAPHAGPAAPAAAPARPAAPMAPGHAPPQVPAPGQPMVSPLSSLSTAIKATAAQLRGALDSARNVLTQAQEVDEITPALEHGLTQAVAQAEQVSQAFDNAVGEIDDIAAESADKAGDKPPPGPGGTPPAPPMAPR